MEIIKNFGVEPVLLAAQIVNFLVLMAILRKFFYKPMLRLLKNRENTIRDGLQKAEEARKLLEKTKEEEKTILKKAREKASTFIKEAKEQSQNLEKEAKEIVKAQTERMIEDARQQIQREAKIAQDALVQYVSKIAVALLEKSLTEILSEKEKREVSLKAINKLQKKN